MVQGTGSSVGKSLLATALCRIFQRDGYRVAPFKAQNMSLNSFVTPDGAEIGRAQAVQAEAARVLPTADMNPVLLKPEADHRSQLVVMGRPEGVIESRFFNRRKEILWKVVTRALDRLRSDFDLVVIEGAGSPAEINLRQGDIVNMEVALYADSPVLLVGDIDKGGVFASLYGTVFLLTPEERELVRGVIVNKFRGDESILKPGLRQLEELTGVPVLGVVPYFTDLYVPEEDSPATHNTLGRPSEAPVIDVAVLALPHIANFDDFDPLKREDAVAVRYVRSQDELGSPDLVIIPGTKTTVSDLGHLRSSGIAERLLSLAGQRTAVIGICGGYQMLGQRLFDPEGVESSDAETPGLGLLPAITRFSRTKQTHQISGCVEANHGLLEGTRSVAFEGYEIHMGTTFTSPSGGDSADVAPLQVLKRSGKDVDDPDGRISGDGWVMGTYVHGLFHNTDLRRGILRQLASRKGESISFGHDGFSQDREYDRLADLVHGSLNIEAIYDMVGLTPP